MKRLLNFILGLLERKDPEVARLEDANLDFWSKLLYPLKISENIQSFFLYKDSTIKKALLEITNLCIVVSEHLTEELVEMNEWQNFKPTVVIGIPSSYKNRGFNQSEEIAKKILSQSILNNSAKLLKNILIKTRQTPIQHSLPRVQRLTNLKKSMKVKDTHLVRNRDIVVVDDITTTGATFIEATRALKEAGARRVLCIAIAH